MKLIALIALAVCQSALANTYPDFTSASNMLVQSEVIRQRMAPFYGEMPTRTAPVKTIKVSLEQYSIQEVFERNSNGFTLIPKYIGTSDVENAPDRNISDTPQFSKEILNNQRNIAQSLTLDKKPIPLQSKNIATVSTLSLPDAFSLSLEFDWKKPYGQFMNQLLKDIQTAKQEGDTEKYKKLTAQYQVWADEYLIKGTPTRVMK